MTSVRVAKEECEGVLDVTYRANPTDRVEALRVTLDSANSEAAGTTVRAYFPLDVTLR